MSTIDPHLNSSTQERSESSAKMLPPSVFWRISDAIPKSLQWAFMALSLILPLAVWWAITAFGIVNPMFLPAPAQVWQAGADLWSSGKLLSDTNASLYRVGLGYLLSMMLSVPIGIVMGSFASIRALWEPIIGFVRYMPAPAFSGLLILYFGLDELPKILLVFIGTVFFNTLMIMDAVKFVPKELIETSYTLGGSRWQVLLRVISPYIFPNIIDTWRINFAAAWQLVIVAELIAANEGLGRRIIVSVRTLRTDEIFVILLVTGLIGLSIDLLFRFWLNLSCKWRTQ